MSIADSIALISSVAALFTAIASFLTLVEMGRQRRSSYKPEITISRQSIFAYPGEYKANIANSWIKSYLSSLNENSKFLVYKVDLYNIGNGAAKDIKIEWEYEIKKMIDHVNTLAQKNFFNIYCRIDDGWVIIEGKDNVKMRFNIDASVNRHIDYMLPASISESPSVVSLPTFLVDLISIYYFLIFGRIDSQNMNAEYDEDLLKFRMNISYNDIGGKSYQTSIHMGVSLTYGGELD